MAKRRGNSEGSIYRRKDGRWEGKYTAHTPAGPKRRAVYGRTRKEAAEKLTQALARQADGRPGFDAGNLTVAEWLDRWLADDVRHTVREGTYQRYEQVARLHIKPSLGRIKLNAVTAAHVRTLYRDKLDSGLSPRSVRYVHATLHKALRQAVADGILAHNPTEAVKAPRSSGKEIRPLDANQVHALLQAASGDREEALFVVAVTTGMRQGEILGLKWQDADLGAGNLSVRRTLAVTEGGPGFAPPKTAKGRRSIKLTTRAVEALRTHLGRQLEEIEQAGDLYDDHGLVFPNHGGGPMNRSSLTRGPYRRLLKRANLPESTRFHDLRHTCATLLLSQGVHPKFVQELLGHATISITLDTYSHVLPGMGDRTAAAMEHALSEAAFLSPPVRPRQ
jgi:integrase